MMARNRDAWRREQVERTRALEAEWLTATTPAPLLARWNEGDGQRKLRLFVCAVCRRIEPLFTDVWERWAVTMAESMADGGGRESWFDEFDENLGPGVSHATSAVASAVLWWDPLLAVHTICEEAVSAVSQRSVPPYSDRTVESSEQAAQADLYRDIFGNPFRPVAVDPRWLTPTVVGLASAIYADRAFDRLPILADALMEAGCDDAAVLDHCRGPGPHVRGCWVVDLLLGKT